MADLPTPNGYTRRAVLGTLGLAAVAGPLALSRAAVAAPTLAWNPDIASQGLGIFEGLEEDRANSHPGFDHIVARGEEVWFYMHRRDRDTTGGGDRQRHESKGMRAGSTPLKPVDGETWRFRHEMFMPSTLRATSRFSHIFQLKTPATNGGPWVTLSLNRVGGAERMRLRAFSTSGSPDIGATDLAPLREKWITIDMTFRMGPSGTGRFVVRNGTGDGAPVVVDSSRSGVRIPDEGSGSGNYIRPKWGIYRSVESAPSDIIDTHLRLRRMQAWRGV